MMFNLNQSKKVLATVGCAVAGLLSFSSAYAANPEPVDVEVEFVAPVTITETNALQFGLLDVNMANLDAIQITPAGGVTDTGGNIVGGAQAAANLTVTATNAQPITIAVGAITANTGYSLAGFTCNYGGGADTACAGAGYSETSAASTTLLIGATLTGDGAAVAGVQNGSFDVTVSYQ
jgi:hypothetical protein